MNRNMLVLVSTILILLGCVPYEGRSIVYEPERSISVFPFYVDGNPVSAVVSERSVFQSALDYDCLAQGNYMRLWINYTNFSDEPILFDPMISFTLTQFFLEKGKEVEHIPIYPSLIFNYIKKEKQSALIANAFTGIAQAASTVPTTYYNSAGVVVQKNDLGEKLDIVNKNNASRARNISDSYEYFINNVNSILIKKNTVFPQQSVSGYLYFEIEGGINREYEPKDYRYELGTKFSDLDLSIQFNPVEGY